MITNAKLDEWTTKRDMLISSAFTTNFKNDNIMVGQTFNELFKTIKRYDLNLFDTYESGEILSFSVNYQDDSNNVLLSEIIADFDVYKELNDLIFDTSNLDSDQISLNSVIYYLETFLEQTVKFDKKREKFYTDNY